MNLRLLVCSSKDGGWKLGEEYDADAVSAVHSEHKIVHLSWNHTGNDLAVFDEYGQISVFTIITALNRLTLLRRFIVDPEDNLSAVVGYMWLNTERMVFSRLLNKKSEANFIALFASSCSEERWGVELRGVAPQADGTT